MYIGYDILSLSDRFLGRRTAPVTYNQGQRRPSWFDIANLPPCNCYDEPGATASVATIENLVTAEVRSGTPPTRIVLIGFSQGGALAMMTALTTLQELGGVASLSGWIPQQSRQVSELHDVIILAAQERL